MYMLNRYNKTRVQQIKRRLHLNANWLSQNCLPDCLSDLTTAISRKVVGKVHAAIPKGIMSDFELTVLQRYLQEWH